jgi:hypothetical protein
MRGAAKRQLNTDTSSTPASRRAVQARSTGGVRHQDRGADRAI